MVGLLFALVVCLMILSQLERTCATIPEEKAEKAPERGGEPVRTEQ